MIRNMNESDKKAVIGLLEETKMFSAAEIELAKEQINIYLNNGKQQDYFLVVAENESSQVVGFMSYGPAPITMGAYDLYWLAVSTRSQGQGYGRELVSWLERQVSVSCRLILIETSSKSKYMPTRRFYRRLGFREVSRIRDFYSPGDDRITFVKYYKKREAGCHGNLATNIV